MRQCCKALRVVLVCRKPSGNGGSSDGISFDLQTPLPVGWVQSGTWSGVSLVGSPQLLRLELRSMEKVWGGCFYPNGRKEVPTEEQAPGRLIWHQGCRCARWARWSPAGVLQCRCVGVGQEVNASRIATTQAGLAPSCLQSSAQWLLPQGIPPTWPKPLKQTPALPRTQHHGPRDPTTLWSVSHVPSGGEFPCSGSESHRRPCTFWLRVAWFPLWSRRGGWSLKNLLQTGGAWRAHPHL